MFLPEGLYTPEHQQKGKGLCYGKEYASSCFQRKMCLEVTKGKTFLFVSFFFFFFLHLCVCACAHTCTWAHMWRSEDNLQEVVLSFDHVGTRDWTKVIWLGGKWPYLLSYLSSPHFFFFLKWWKRTLRCPGACNFSTQGPHWKETVRVRKALVMPLLFQEKHSFYEGRNGDVNLTLAFFNLRSG